MTRARVLARASLSQPTVALAVGGVGAARTGSARKGSVRKGAVPRSPPLGGGLDAVTADYPL